LVRIAGWAHPPLGAQAGAQPGTARYYLTVIPGSQRAVAAASVAIMRTRLLIVVMVALLAVVSASASARNAHFKSPTGNINCILTGGFADCLLLHNTWSTLPKKPKWCTLDWNKPEVILNGHKLQVGSCRGDIGPLCGPSSDAVCTVLRYGQTASTALITCTSRSNGVTCRRRTGRHQGFRIAREGYVLYR
jgi:hypothetical protein